MSIAGDSSDLARKGGGKFSQPQDFGGLCISIGKVLLVSEVGDFSETGEGALEAVESISEKMEQFQKAQPELCVFL